MFRSENGALTAPFRYLTLYITPAIDTREKIPYPFAQ